MFKELEDISNYKKIIVLDFFGEKREIETKDIKNISFEDKSFVLYGDIYLKISIVIDGELYHTINSYYNSDFYYYVFYGDDDPRIDEIYIYTETEKYTTRVIDSYTAYIDNLPFPRINRQIDDDGISTDDYVLSIWANIMKETI